MAERRGRGAAVALALAAVPPLVLILAISVPLAAGASSGAASTTESGTPSESPSGSPSEPSSSPSPSDTVLPTPTPTPSRTTSPTSAAPTATETAEPDPTATPSPTAPTIDPAAHDLRPATTHAILTADASTMTGLSFEGVVVHETGTGEVRALRFTADANRLVDMQVDVSGGGRTLRTTTQGTTVLSGDVVMDVTVFSARLLGAPVEFTPDNPPPLVLPVMTFTAVETHLVLVQADRMDVPANRQTFLS